MSNQYVPEGSYLLTSRDVVVTLEAQCEQTGGNWVQSPPLKYSAGDASFRDIANIEGTLKTFEGDSSAPNPTDQYGQFVPAGSYELTSQDIYVTISAMCEQTGGNWVQSPPLKFSVSEAATIRDIANIEGELKIFH